MPAFPIPVIRTAESNAQELLGQLRTKLSPDGNMVSAAGRERTIAVFGEPLTPVQAVQRICRDVQSRGLDAALEYTAKLDDRTLTAESIRVSDDELVEAHRSVDQEFLQTVRRIRANIEQFQRGRAAGPGIGAGHRGRASGRAF